MHSFSRRRRHALFPGRPVAAGRRFKSRRGPLHAVVLSSPFWPDPKFSRLPGFGSISIPSAVTSFAPRRVRQTRRLDLESPGWLVGAARCTAVTPHWRPAATNRVADRMSSSSGTVGYVLGSTWLLASVVQSLHRRCCCCNIPRSNGRLRCSTSGNNEECTAAAASP